MIADFFEFFAERADREILLFVERCYIRLTSFFRFLVGWLSCYVMLQQYNKFTVTSDAITSVDSQCTYRRDQSTRRLSSPKVSC